MVNHFRRLAQVSLLTFVMIFGTLLMVGSFDTPSWSDAHHGYTRTTKVHHDWFFWWYTGQTHVHGEYHNGGHDDNTTH